MTQKKQESLENLSCILLVCLIALSFAIQASKLLVCITLFTGIGIFCWLTFLAIRDDSIINYALIKCECMAFFVLIATSLLLHLDQPILFIVSLLLLLYLVSNECKGKTTNPTR